MTVGPVTVTTGTGSACAETGLVATMHAITAAMAQWPLLLM
jgi:hypothetical protein